MTEKNTPPESVPVHRVVGHADSDDECWSDFMRGDINAGFDWALHPNLGNRSERMVMFLTCARTEMEKLRLIVDDTKRHVACCEGGVGGFIRLRIDAFECLPNRKDDPAGVPSASQS